MQICVAFLENATTVEIWINSLTTHIKMKPVLVPLSDSTGKNVQFETCMPVFLLLVNEYDGVYFGKPYLEANEGNPGIMHIFQLL